ncbi:MAG: preprotein translocase subunit SecE [Gammaproteobacteria bacterium]|nr:preprotein translocase subunit SecE [Gammaproteobacteria bacterium]
MNEKIKAPQKSLTDMVKWGVALFLFLAGFGANYYFIQVPLTLRLAGWVVLACIIAFIAIQTTSGQRLWHFFKAARSEIRKVVWPTRQETFHTTLMVIVIIILFAVIMWGADSFLMWLISWLTG